MTTVESFLVKPSEAREVGLVSVQPALLSDCGLGRPAEKPDPY